ALTDTQGAFGATIRDAGFDLPGDTAALLTQRAIWERDARSIAESLQVIAVRTALAARLNILPSALDEQQLWRFLDDDGRAKWFHDYLQTREHSAAGFDATYLRKIARLQREDLRLLRAERSLDSAAEGGMDERVGWLLLASIVVCVVGIANAMLMAVTERFREIATLKCLGALDGTIMTMFVQEAALLGVVGGSAGALMGAIIGLTRMLFRFRNLLWGAIPWGGLFSAMGMSLALGIVLAAFASVYPSFKAARLAPMEAMRIE
ncbi:MAG: ABC transporter permease, partial [Kiritimatiellia bacterium]